MKNKVMVLALGCVIFTSGFALAAHVYDRNGVHRAFDEIRRCEDHVHQVQMANHFDGDGHFQAALDALHNAHHEFEEAMRAAEHH